MFNPIADLYMAHARQINFCLLVAVVIAMTAASIVRREKMIRRTRRIWFWFYLLMVNLAYATADNLKDGIRVNPPVVIGGIIFLGLLCSMLWNPPGDDKLPPEDSSISTRFVLFLDRMVRRAKERKIHVNRNNTKEN